MYYKMFSKIASTLPELTVTVVPKHSGSTLNRGTWGTTSHDEHVDNNISSLGVDAIKAGTCGV